MDKLITKTIKGNSILNLDTLIFFIINTVLISQLIKIGASLWAIISSVVVVNVLDILFTYKRFYYFSYNAQELIIKHYWFKKDIKYLLQDLESIKIIKAPKSGRAVMVVPKIGLRRSYGANYVKTELLNEMIDFIADHIPD